MVQDNVINALSSKLNYQYRYWWSRFDQLCTSFGLQKEPCNAATAAGFFTWLAEESEGLGGVDQARSALRNFPYVRYNEIISPTRNACVYGG